MNTFLLLMVFFVLGVINKYLLLFFCLAIFFYFIVKENVWKKIFLAKMFWPMFVFGCLVILYVYILWSVVGYGHFAGIIFDINTIVDLLMLIVVLLSVYSDIKWKDRIALYSFVAGFMSMMMGNIGLIEYVYFFFLFGLILLFSAKEKYWGLAFALGYFLFRGIIDFKLVLDQILVALFPGAYILAIIIFIVVGFYWQKKGKAIK